MSYHYYNLERDRAVTLQRLLSKRPKMRNKINYEFESIINTRNIELFREKLDDIVDPSVLLLMAINSEFIDGINLLFEKYPDIHVDEYGVVCACMTKNTDVIKILIDHTKFENVLVNVISDVNQRSLQLFLNKSYINVNAQDKFGNTSLMLLTIKNAQNEIEMLLNHPDIDVELINNDGYNIIDLAFINRRYSLINLYLKKYPKLVDKDKYSNYIIESLREKYYLDINLDYYNINHQDEYGNTALMYACINNDDSLINRLLKHKDIDTDIVNNNGQTCLMLSIPHSFDLIVDKCKNSINYKDSLGNNCMHYAIKHNSPIIFKQLSNFNELNINEQNFKGESPLLMALNKKALNTVTYLIDNENIDINLSDVNGKTPLMYAIDFVCDLRGNHGLIFNKIFANKNLDINAQNSKEQTALIYAIRKKMNEASLPKEPVQYFIDSSEYSLYPDCFSQDISMMYNGQKQDDVIDTIIFALIDKSDVNMVDDYNKTAMNYAIESYDVGLFNKLLTCIDVNAKTGDDECTYLMHIMKKIINCDEENAKPVNQPMTNPLQNIGKIPLDNKIYGDFRNLPISSDYQMRSSNEMPTSVTSIKNTCSNKLIYFLKKMVQHPDIDMNIKDIEDNTVLSMAAACNTNILKIILDKTDNVNNTNIYGHSPLFIAAENNLWKNTILLIKRGADTNIKCDKLIYNNLVKRYSEQKSGWFS